METSRYFRRTFRLIIAIVTLCCRGAHTATCDSPKSPTKGIVTYTSLDIGAVATYSCDEGYALDGVTNATCNQCTYGPCPWSESPPNCNMVDCGHPVDNPNSMIYCPSGTHYTDQCVGSCDAGYYMSSGATQLTCQSNGQWDLPKPVCTIVDCGMAAPPANGDTVHTGTTYDSIVSYVCNTGFTLVGVTSRACNASALWTDTAPVCSPLNCSASIANPTDGFVVCPSQQVGDNCTFGCNVGYSLSGEAVLTCLANGTWDFYAPKCHIVDCGQPVTPNNGSISVLLTTYMALVNSTCDTGFDLNGTAMIQCTASGLWSNPGPTCVIKDCGLPPSVPDGTVAYTTSTYTSSAVYACNTGYNLTGGSVIVCNASGVWNTAAPTCNVVDCGQPVTPINGTINVLLTTYMALVNFTCDTGFDLNGTAMIQCTASGLWSSPGPTCVLKDCGLPPSVLDGSVSYTTTTYTSSAVYTCNTGFNLTGGSVVVCNASGLWDNTAPTCSLVDCGQPSTPSNGSISAPLTTYLSHAFFACDAGFDLLGPVVLECTAAAVWNDTSPLCTVKECGPPPNTTNGYVTYALTTFGANVTYACLPGYDINGSTLLTCNASGLWNDTAPVCVIKDCGSPVTPINGNAVFTMTTFGASVNYTCHAGFDIIGGDTRTCNASGLWDGMPPSCVVIDCGAPATPTNGNTTYTLTTFGASVNYTCNLGYILSGIDTRTCTAPGLWDGITPTCSIIDCGPLANPTNGNAVFTMTTFGSSVNYTCDTGFDIIGVDTRTCNASGTWDGMPPSCVVIDCGTPATPINGNAVFTITTFGSSANYTCDVGFDIIGVDTRTCNASGVWDGMSPSCVVIDCGAPATPANGNTTFTLTTFGASVNYTCNVGYSLSGIDTRTCNASGLWSDTEPVCVPDGCGMLMNPTDGFVTCPSQQAGDNCNFACNVGFNLIGTSSVICQASGTWDLPSPTCSIVDCGPLSAVGNGSIASPGSTVYGDIVYYTCDTGFTLVGVTSRTCNANGMWSNTEPVCVAITCGLPANPSNGVVTCSSFALGGECTFSCHVSYTLVGWSNATCVAINIWSSAPPICDLTSSLPCHIQWASPVTRHYHIQTTAQPDYTLISTTTSPSAMHCVTRCNAHARANCISGNGCRLVMYDKVTRECNRYYLDTMSGITIGCDASVTRVCYRK